MRCGLIAQEYFRRTVANQLKNAISKIRNEKSKAGERLNIIAEAMKLSKLLFILSHLLPSRSFITSINFVQDCTAR
jgi:hypothetical protein